MRETSVKGFNLPKECAKPTLNLYRVDEKS